MFNVLVRTRLQVGAEFPGVAAIAEGFGAGGGLTLRSVRYKLEAQQERNGRAR